MIFLLSERSESRLVGVHDDLVRVVRSAIRLTKVDFVVIEGVRTLEKQREYFKAGKSKTMKSRHITGHAVDIMPWLDTDGDGDKEASWELSNFYPINDAMQAASRDCGVPIEWGGDWKTFLDAPHFQLPWSRYP